MTDELSLLSVLDVLRRVQGLRKWVVVYVEQCGSQ
jgi:hypothetical protein